MSAAAEVLLFDEPVKIMGRDTTLTSQEAADGPYRRGCR